MTLKNLCWILLAGCLAGSAGCTTKSAFNSAGMPDKRFFVGGGLSIEYKAKEAGTVYWVEEKTQKILEMKSVDKGQSVDFGGDIDTAAVEKVVGIPINSAKFTLYFIPQSEKPVVK